MGKTRGRGDFEYSESWGHWVVATPFSVGGVATPFSISGVATPFSISMVGKV
jgi:hypothetical protein